MRVTNPIRDYIRRQVEEIIQFPDESERRAERAKIAALREDAQRRITKFCKEFEAQLTQKWEAFLKTNPDIVAPTACSLDARPSITVPPFCVTRQIESNNRADALIALRDRKTDEIIISLELGGTKADLDAMLQALRDEIAG